MSEFTPARSAANDALNGRYYRKLELLYYCNRYKTHPIEQIFGKLSDEGGHLNSGQNFSVFRTYLKEFQFGNFCLVKNHSFFITLLGDKALKEEWDLIRRYFKPIDDLEEVTK